MKKKIGLILSIFGIFIMQPLHAQLDWGIKGGLNMSKTGVSGSDLKSDNYTGFFIGPMIEFTIPVIGFGFDAGLLYAQNGMAVDGVSLDGGTTCESLKQQTLELPIEVRYTIGLGRILGLFFNAGPQFGFVLNTEDSKYFEASDFKFKRTNLSVNVGVGLKVIKHLQVGLNYNIGLGKTAEYEGIGSAIKDFSLDRNTWQVSLAYLF